MRTAFIGYGDLGKQISEFVLAELTDESELLFFDDALSNKAKPNAHPFADYSKNCFEDAFFYLCLGYKHLEKKVEIFKTLNQLRRKTPPFIHSHAYVSPSSVIGAGSVIYPMCNLDKDTKTGSGCVLHNSAIVSHNSLIGDCCYLSPCAVISGNVTVGAKTFIGAGAIIANNVKIGENVIIGAGTVITADIPDNCSVIGNPMRILNNRLNLV